MLEDYLETATANSVCRISSLVHLCQRVLAANIDAVCGFGEEMPHRLVKPILQGCSVDTILRLEHETPHLISDNEDLWKDQCFRSYPVLADRYNDPNEPEPVSWRSEFLHLREEEARRLEEAGNRIRNQRLEAEELKRKRQVKITDRLPPPKRTRQGWSNGPAPPKTLFQKTRAEATKLQKSVFGCRINPPLPSNTKSSRPKIGAPSISLFPPVHSASIAVTTVSVRKSCPPSHSPSESMTGSGVSSSPISKSAAKVPGPHVQPLPEVQVSPSPSGMSKKNPKTALFVPKHKAHSQLSTPALSSHSLSHRIDSR